MSESGADTAASMNVRLLPQVQLLKLAGKVEERPHTYTMRIAQLGVPATAVQDAQQLAASTVA